MLLCDVGNTHASFYQAGKVSQIDVKALKEFKPPKRVFYISVNEGLKPFLQSSANFFNIEPFFSIDSEYVGLGIDRIAACYEIKNGIIIDAGSAITFDVKKNGKHMGGFIMPGLSAIMKAFCQISPRLNVHLNSAIDLNALPLCTKDALSYGAIAPIIATIKQNIHDEKLYFTGGDGKFLSKFFKNTVYDKTLVFRAMQKVVIENGLV